MPLLKLSEEYRVRLQTILRSSVLVPVITIHKPEHAVPLGKALIAGGIHVMEITLRTPGALEAVSRVRHELPEVWVGAGTIREVRDYEDAQRAGAQFVVSPGVTEALLNFGTTASAPLLPGISTVSELMMGYQHGYRDFKFFPAEAAGGINTLKAFAGPFSEVRFCPTGGIRPDTAADYLALNSVIAVGGTWLTPQEVLDAEDWDRISEIARSSLEHCQNWG